MVTRKQSHKKLFKNRFKIKVSKNGPYIISGGVPLADMMIVRDAEGIAVEWRNGKKYPSQGNYRLCRCGQSKNKPFCDGTHEHIQFDGTETASNDSYLSQAREINGPSLKLTDALKLCVHARFCDRAGGIWKLTERSDDPEAREIAIQEAGECPSGRLVVWDKEDNEIEPEFEPGIIVVEDPQKGTSGPLWVRGDITIESDEGVIYEVRNRITLCRCGKSANKPFCDGSHFEQKR